MRELGAASATRAKELEHAREKLEQGALEKGTFELGRVAEA